MPASYETLVQQITVWALPILLALTLSELAHGWTARALGDTTGQKLGRLSLNPLRHIDPIGTLLVPTLLIVAAALGLRVLPFGWARPIPLDFRNMKNPRRDMACVAAAGPLANFAMALLWAVLLRTAAAPAQAGFWFGLKEMENDGVIINLWLLVLNLLPIPPMDSGRALIGVLPREAAIQLARVEPYGMMILLAMMVMQVLIPILAVPYGLAQSVVVGLVGL